MPTKEARTANRRLAQWRVTWLNQVQCFYWSFVQADSFVLLSPPPSPSPKTVIANAKNLATFPDQFIITTFKTNKFEF